MAFEPENALERALVRAVHEPDARPEFYRLLMACDLYVGGRVGDGRQAQGTMKLSKGDQLHLSLVERDGRRLHPVFSALSRLDQFAPQGSPYFQLLGRELFASARGAHFVLNPGSEIGKELAPDEIQYWLAQLVGRRIEVNAQRTIVAPESYPDKLVRALGILFVNRQVASARLAEIRREGQKARLLIAVETEANWRKLSGEIAMAANEALPGFALELVRLNPGDTRDLYARQLLAIAPFFER